MTTAAAERDLAVARHTGAQVHQMMWMRRMAQRDMAEVVGVSQSTLSKKLRGEVPISVDELVVLGKGGKVRAVPILCPDLHDRLAALDGWAFPNRLGSHMTPGHVSRLLSAALPGDWTGHSLRHRMASVAYAGTRDLLAVGAVLGHSRPETTQRYVKMPDDAIRAAVRAAVA